MSSPGALARILCGDPLALRIELIKPLSTDELIVRSLFDDPTVAHDDYFISRSNTRDAMRHH
jgi:hypothetical protein